MTSKRAQKLVEKVFEKSGLGKWFRKDESDIKTSDSRLSSTFVVEGTGNVVNMTFSGIQAQNLKPYDVVINKSGKVFNVDCIEINESNLTVTMTTSDNQEIVESFLPEAMMGLVDTVHDTTVNEYGDAIEIYEDSKKKVKLNKIMRGDVKKYKVYVKNDKGNVVKVNFGDPNMEIKRDDPARRKNFRARHHCENPGPRWKARYWACRTWSSKSVSSMLKENNNVCEQTNDVQNMIVENTIISIQNLDYNPSLWGHLNQSK
jgi:hypothetical protein